jgi:hypothetical protein
MNIANMLGFVNDRLFQDVSWFLLLCAIFAFLRFHRWGNTNKAAPGGEHLSASTHQTGASGNHRKAA